MYKSGTSNHKWMSPDFAMQLNIDHFDMFFSIDYKSENKNALTRRFKKKLGNFLSLV